MKLNNSFLLGILVASFTWIITIYLYYTLNSNSLEVGVASNPPKIDSSNFLPNQLENHVVNKDKSKVGKGDFEEKYKKYKKEKKYSQKLIDELIPVKIPSVLEKEEYGAINNLEDQLVRDDGYKNHAFNVLVSNNIGNFRDLPDTRTLL